MKMKYIMSVLLAAASLGLAGCSTTSSSANHDPLMGWNFDLGSQPDQAIVRDYQGYIQNLPPDLRSHVGIINIFKDGNGQHAVRIEVGQNGAPLENILFYDKDGNRVRVVKYDGNNYVQVN